MSKRSRSLTERGLPPGRRGGASCFVPLNVNAPVRALTGAQHAGGAVLFVQGDDPAGTGRRGFLLTRVLNRGGTFGRRGWLQRAIGEHRLHGGTKGELEALDQTLQRWLWRHVRTPSGGRGRRCQIALRSHRIGVTRDESFSRPDPRAIPQPARLRCTENRRPQSRRLPGKATTPHAVRFARTACSTECCDSPSRCEPLAGCPVWSRCSGGSPCIKQPTNGAISGSPSETVRPAFLNFAAPMPSTISPTMSPTLHST